MSLPFRSFSAATLLSAAVLLPGCATSSRVDKLEQQIDDVNRKAEQALQQSADAQRDAKDAISRADAAEKRAAAAADRADAAARTSEAIFRKGVSK
ncbi:MAG TPA: Lpp/OprI family alanine-zipper lipoprotein [Myxococcota bacterium]|jgi:outer membrane biogenesis lipoprotein LolB|nr:Lpp/OprI family alanine-zipper lipoprotein [Myxococcota bacterium]